MTLPTTLAVGLHCNDGEIADLQQNMLALQKALGVSGVPSGYVLTNVSGNQQWAAATGGLTPVTKSASYSANANEMVLMSTPAANAVVTLPTPTSGATVGLADVSGFAGGASDGTGKLLSITAVSGLINGFASWVCFDDYGTATLIADGSNWNFVSGIDHWMPDPRNLSPQFWIDPGRGYTLSNAGSAAVPQIVRCTALADQSGNALNFSQGTTASAPFFDRGGLSGRGRLLFNGTTLFMLTANFTPPSATATFLLVLQAAQLGTSVFAAVLGQSANVTAGQGFAVFTAISGGTSDTTLKGFVSGDAAAGSTLGVGGAIGATGFNSAADLKLTPHLLTFTIDGATPYIHLDGFDVTSQVSTTTITSPQSSPIYIGQDHFGGANSDWYQGAILDAVYIAGSKTASQIKAYEVGLMRKHRIRL